jgi:predicted outer membrane repeat protein
MEFARVRRISVKVFAVPLFGLLWLVLAAAPAHAAGVVGNGTPGSCTDAAYAAAIAGGGLVTFNCGPSPVTISVTTKVIGSGATTTVDGGDRVILDAGGLLQHFLVLGGGALNLRHITLQRGSFGDGGAIFVAQDGSAQLDTVTIRDCEADGSDADGGAIQNRGTLVVAGAQFLRNHADDGGGAINNNGGAVTIRSTTFISNTAFNGGAINNAAGNLDINTALIYSSTVDNQGGGLFATGGTITVTNVTLANNSAYRGGGIYGQNNAAITLLNSTVYANQASSAAGGIWNNTAGAGANVILKNTIVAFNNNTNTGILNCDGPAMRTLGHNLIGDGTCITAVTGDLKNTDPKLGPLADYGGTALSYLPLAGSPAIDAGDNTSCPSFDQRGYPRPIAAACDIGAVEAGSALWLPQLRRAP